MVDSALRLLGDAIDPWGYLLVFAVTALEASALIGLVVPGEATLLFSGFLAFQGRMVLWPLIVLAVTGSVVGDSIGYELGRHFGSRLEHSWVGRKIGSTRWAQARAHLRHSGPQAVLVGRFVGLLRALVPAAAGDARMPYRSFLTWNVIGAVVWAPAVIAAGYLAGESYQAVARWLGWGSLAVAAVIAVAAVTARVMRQRRRRDNTTPANTVTSQPSSVWSGLR